MIRTLVAYVGTAVVFAGLDAIWLTATNASLYRPTLGPLLADSVRPVPALLFYVIYLGGVVLFAVTPALRSGRWQTALLLGAGLGFVAYATYDLTNQATLKLWATKITLLDLAWGTFVTAAGATAGFWAARLVKL